MILRAASELDAEGLAGVHAACFPAPWSAAQIARLLAAAGGFAFIAEDPAAETGFILCRVMADEAEILTLGTRPSHRREGIARALLTAAAAAARSRGAGSLFLEVAADNVPAIALYCAHGFIAVGMRRGYYARPTAPAADALVLRLALNR